MEELVSQLARAIGLGLDAAAVLIVAVGSIDTAGRIVVGLARLSSVPHGEGKVLWRRFGMWLLLALEFLQELFWSLNCRLTIWLLFLLLIRLIGLVGLILRPGILLGKLFVHLLGFLPRRNHPRRHALRLGGHRLIPAIGLRRGGRRGYVTRFAGDDYMIECVGVGR